MLEKIGKDNVIVRDYTDNFAVKEYIQKVLLPKKFPDIPVTKLNATLAGIVGEYMGDAVEDSYHTSSLMLNENFITKAVLPESIYAEAGLFDIGYTFASPSRCNFALEVWIEDIIKYGKPLMQDTLLTSDVVTTDFSMDGTLPVNDTGRRYYIIDRDTKIIIGDSSYRLDYDIVIEWKKNYEGGPQGSIPFKAYYRIPDAYDIKHNQDFGNSIAITKNRWITCRVSQSGWLILLVTAQEFTRNVETFTISDNLRTTNSDIILRWTNQIAGFDLVHVDNGGNRTPMKKKIMHTDYELTPFVYYSFEDDHTIRLSFSPAIAAWRPKFNDKIEATVYTTRGARGNFDSIEHIKSDGTVMRSTNSIEVIVEKTGERYEYNADTNIVGVCYSGSILGADKKDIEMLRSDVKLAYNTVKVLSTDHDLKEWFNNFAKRYNTRAEFFKRRDDPTGRLFSQFVAISDGDYVFPTNTLTIDASENLNIINGEPVYDMTDVTINPDTDTHIISKQFDDVINDNEFIIYPGHIWEYTMDTVVETKKELDGNGDPIEVTYTHRVPSRDRVTMVRREDGSPAMIWDNQLPTLKNPTELDPNGRPFMFVNPFLIKIHKRPQVMACYNYLTHHSSYMNEVNFDYGVEASYFQFQATIFSIDRTLIQPFNGRQINRYTVKVVINPILSESSIGQLGYQYIKRDNSNPDIPAAYYKNNNLRVILTFKTEINGETGYMEMYPTKFLDGGLIEFEAEFAIYDDIDKRGMIFVDVDTTKSDDGLGNNTITVIKDVAGTNNINSTIALDGSSTRFGIKTLINTKNELEDNIFGIPENPMGDEENRYGGYRITNVFENDYHDLSIYKPMTMMRSTVTFAGASGEYNIRASLIPMVAYNLACDDAKMSTFIKQFNEQYSAVEPVIFERLDNNCHLDLKLFNTYGRSNNYYIGDGTDQKLLDDVSVGVIFQMSVKDRMGWTATADAVTTEIRDYFNTINEGNPNIYISNLIRVIETNNPNVDHLRFIGITSGHNTRYDPKDQYIKVGYQDVSDLNENEMKIIVPEILQCELKNIQLIEET